MASKRASTAFVLLRLHAGLRGFPLGWPTGKLLSRGTTHQHESGLAPWTTSHLSQVVQEHDHPDRLFNPNQRLIKPPRIIQASQTMSFKAATVEFRRNRSNTSSTLFNLASTRFPATQAPTFLFAQMPLPQVSPAMPGWLQHEPRRFSRGEARIGTTAGPRWYR